MNHQFYEKKNEMKKRRYIYIHIHTHSCDFDYRSSNVMIIYVGITNKQTNKQTRMLKTEIGFAEC